eukprot:scaffold5707_cov112-Cylindrotheca_fusiformis.AAC.2
MKCCISCSTFVISSHISGSDHQMQRNTHQEEALKSHRVAMWKTLDGFFAEEHQRCSRNPIDPEFLSFHPVNGHSFDNNSECSHSTSTFSPNRHVPFEGRLAWTQLDESIFHKSLAHSLGDAFEPRPFQEEKTTSSSEENPSRLLESKRTHLPINIDCTLGDALADDDSSLNSFSSSTTPAASLDEPTQQTSSEAPSTAIIDNDLKLSPIKLPKYPLQSRQQHQWDSRFNELVQLQRKLGICYVPVSMKSSHRDLCRWVKRQRHQYKLLQEGKPSTLTLYRIKKLQEIDFVWDAHASVWDERLNELREFYARHGHCNVTNRYKKNPKLATWVKSQRRQFKLYMSGEKTNMTPERIDSLDQIQFQWEIRKKH